MNIEIFARLNLEYPLAYLYDCSIVLSVND